MRKFLTIAFFAFGFIFTGAAQVNSTDSLALVDLYNSTNGASWTNNTNWLTSAKVSTWYGVETAGGYVSSLDLRNNNVVGTLPSSLTNITRLYTLILSGNNLSGSIPSAIGNIATLQRLVLSDNNMSGAIPASITTLINLYELNLINNGFTGNIPSDIGSMAALRFIWLNSNSFDGSIPASIMNLSNLEAMALNDNNLTGSIPSGFAGIANCREIYLGNNNLSGSIPSDINGATALQQLWLDDNSLDGAVTSQILNLSNLRYLGLSNNQLTGNIHDYPSSMPNLEWAFLQGNNFDKIIGMSSSAAFTYIDVSSNRLKFFQLNNAASPPATFIYAPQDSIGTTIDTTINEGDDYNILLSDVTTGNAYTWYKNGVLQNGITTSYFPLTGITSDDNGVYHCEITNSGFPDLTLVQRTVTINVTCTAPEITTEPSNITITENFNTTFSIAANYSISYQWQVDTGSGFTNVVDGSNYSGSTSDILTVINTPSEFNGYNYRCIVVGGCTPNDTSNTATITVSSPISTYTKYVQDATYGNQNLNVTVPPTTANNVYVKPATRVGASYYSVQISKRSDFSSGVLEKTGTTSTHWYFNNLDADSTYYCRANVNGGDYTVIKSFVIESGALLVGTSVMGKTYDLTYGWQSGSGNPTTATSVYCRPTPVTGATQWTVEVNSDSNFDTATAQIKIGPDWSKIGYYYFKSLTPNTTYYVRVMVDNEGVWGNTKTFTTDGVATRPLATPEEIFEVGEAASAMEFDSEGSEIAQKNAINAYPNPFNESINVHVESKETQRMSIRVFDVTGKMVENINTNTNETIRIGSDLNSGIYIMNMVYGDNSEQVRIVKN